MEKLFKLTGGTLFVLEGKVLKKGIGCECKLLGLYAGNNYQFNPHFNTEMVKLDGETMVQPVKLTITEI